MPQHCVRRLRLSVGLRRALRGVAVFALAAAAATVGALAPATAPRVTALHPTALPVTMAAAYSDGARTIFGLSGAFGTCSGIKCGPAGPISLQQVARVGSGYIRVGATLNCPFTLSQPLRPGIGNSAATLHDILTQAASAGIIPIVDVVTPDDCGNASPPLTPDDWRAQLRAFVATIYGAHWYPPSRMLYFEIGNEVNLFPGPYCGTLSAEQCRNGGWEHAYAQTFGAAAQGVQEGLAAFEPAHYRVLTAGMVEPTASYQRKCTDYFNPGLHNISAAVAAIRTAEHAPFHIAPAHLGVSVHPYKYDTAERSYWVNYYFEGNHYVGKCFDLQAMIALWTTTFRGMPVVFTEANWSDAPNTNPQCIALPRCEGTYMVDLFTWLYDHPHPGRGSYADPRSSPLRVIFFRGVDSPHDLLGLYALGPGGIVVHDKQFWTGDCPGNPAVYGWKSMATAFANLATASLTGLACY